MVIKPQQSLAILDTQHFQLFSFVVAFPQTLKEDYQSLSQVKLQEYQRNAMLKRTLFQLQASRKRTNSTGSAWSSGLSESSTDSDKGLLNMLIYNKHSFADQLIMSELLSCIVRHCNIFVAPLCCYSRLFE